MKPSTKYAALTMVALFILIFGYQNFAPLKPEERPPSILFGDSPNEGRQQNQLKGDLLHIWQHSGHEKLKYDLRQASFTHPFEIVIQNITLKSEDNSTRTHSCSCVGQLSGTAQNGALEIKNCQSITETESDDCFGFTTTYQFTLKDRQVRLCEPSDNRDCMELSEATAL